MKLNPVELDRAKKMAIAVCEKMLKQIKKHGLINSGAFVNDNTFIYRFPIEGYKIRICCSLETRFDN